MNASAAVGLGAPTGITMLSEKSVQPSVGIRNWMSGLSAWSWTASPDQPMIAAASPFARSRA